MSSPIELINEKYLKYLRISNQDFKPSDYRVLKQTKTIEDFKALNDQFVPSKVKAFKRKSEFLLTT